jgi:hypothetical protein
MNFTPGALASLAELADVIDGTKLAPGTIESAFRTLPALIEMDDGSPEMAAMIRVATSLARYHPDYRADPQTLN